MFALAFINYLPAFFGAAGTSCTLAKPAFFFLPTWWEYLGQGTQDFLGQCTPTVVFTNPADITAIALAILDMLLRVAGFVAVGSLIFAGIQHLFTDGNPEKAAAARRRIYNSIIGLVIALTATALVTFVGNQVAG
jgi:hypothetical protein